ncbi:MAG TPA: S1C family serine protease [Acidobacteriota bacterium]|nr:S1C family serine protease [Acidobacteriota bacterium]
MKKSTKMVTSFLVTVRKSTAVLLLAVFFSPAARAVDSSLYSLETGLGELIYSLSRSLVTVESFSRVSVGGPGAPHHEVLRNLIASGLIVDTAGHILVAAETVLGQDRVLVKFENNRTPARLVAVDYHNMLALLETGRRLGEPLVYSDGHGCAGQVVLAMGNAYGLRVSPTLGICAGARANGDLQFSIPMTSGAVGGGVFDLSGRLLGVITGSLGDQGRIVLAVPAYRVEPVVQYLLTRGDRYPGFAGIRTREIEIDPPIRTELPRSPLDGGGQTELSLDAGMVVTAVLPFSPAEQAGLRKGDLIFALGDRRIRTGGELSGIIRQCESGMVINVEVVRLNTHFSVPLTVGRREILRQGRPRDTADQSLDEQRQLVDSLSRVLERFREEVTRLERQLDGID